MGHSKKKYKNKYANVYGNSQYYYNPITGQQMYNPQFVPTAAPVQMSAPMNTMPMNAMPMNNTYANTMPIQGYGVSQSVHMGRVNNNNLPRAQRFSMYKSNKKFCKRCKIEYKKMKNTSIFSFGKSLSLGMQSSFHNHTCGMFK